MKQLDVYYRALLEYREQTQQNKACASDSRAVIKANTDLDAVVLTRKHCIVEEDWVDAIEEGLKYVAKAIAEERQFIHSNGETLPIEKIKNVSKDSVVHLAKHSNLITREIPGQDIIPDQLYTVEKLSDYAVYENKFLYLLLCYLRDFITIRYNKILELSNTYHGTMTMNKVVKTANRTIKYSVNLAEEKRDDDYLKETNQAKDIISRIDLLLKTVIAFLSTPLMQFVSKAPMIKPPITKTNVLKMNNNFKQSLNLYGYIVAYDRDGYTVETEVKEISPFSDELAEEMSETILLSSFITYEHSLGIEAQLKRNYELEQQRRKERELEEFREKLQAARLKVQKSEMSMEEYILMLEKHIRALEKKAKELDKVKAELAETQALLQKATEENEELKANLERTINELEAEKLRYITDMAALKLAHEEEIKSLVTEYEDKISEIIETHKNEMRDLSEKYENRIAEINEAHKNQIDQINEAHQNHIDQINEAHENQLTEIQEEHQNQIQNTEEAHEQFVNELNEKHTAEIDAKDAEIAALNERLTMDKAIFDSEVLRMQTEYSATLNGIAAENMRLRTEMEEEIKQRRYLYAQYLALKKETGRLTEEDDHVTQLKFDELQHTFELFHEFYKKEWEKAKRYIRRDAFKFLRRKKNLEEQEAEKAATSPEKVSEPLSEANVTDQAAPNISNTPDESEKSVEQVTFEKTNATEQAISEENGATKETSCEDGTATEQESSEEVDLTEQESSEEVVATEPESSEEHNTAEQDSSKAVEQNTQTCDPDESDSKTNAVTDANTDSL